MATGEDVNTLWLQLLELFVACACKSRDLDRMATRRDILILVSASVNDKPKSHPRAAIAKPGRQ